MTVYFKNYYSSIQQLSDLASIAFDEGPLPNIAAVGVNTSSINTTEIDPFRQGVEITQNKHAYSGIFKISAGTPGHIIDPVCFGANDEITIVSSKYYVEVDSYNPVSYLSATPAIKEKTYATEEDFLDKRSIYNGTIEPLTIRSAENFLSTELPYEMRSVKGEYSAGNTDQFTLSNDEILTVDYVPKKLITNNRGDRLYENKAYFVDRFSTSNLSPGSGTLNKSAEQSTTANGNIKYYMIDLTGSNFIFNSVGPFDDAKKYLKMFGITVATHGADMVAVFDVMTGSTGNYVPPDKKSATTGFVYDNIGYAGTDSIAFGGMTY